MKNKFGGRLFWGLFLLCSASLIIANQLGYLANVSLLSVVMTVAFVAIIINSLTRLEFIGVTIPLAFIAIIYAKPLGLEAIVPWGVLVAALFAGIGLNLLIKSNKRRWHQEDWEFTDHHGKHFRRTIENMDENVIYNKVSFGAETKYIHSTELKKAEFICSFGELKVFLDQATLCPDGANIDVNCSFGSIVLYVPRSWMIKDKSSAFAGDIKFVNQPQPDVNSPVLTITGSTSFGAVMIHYI